MQGHKLASNTEYRSKRKMQAHRSLAYLLSVWALLLLALSSFEALGVQEVRNLRVWHSPESTRVVFDVSENVAYKTFKLENPSRLVVDLADTVLTGGIPVIDGANKHISSIRSGSPSGNTLRVVFDLKQELKVASFVLAPNELYGHRLVVDLGSAKIEMPQSQSNIADSPVNDRERKTNLDPRSVEVSGDVTRKEKAPNRKFVVAIDAGHGGDDPGAIGHRGSYEKKLTLAIAKKLFSRVNENPRLKAVMVRTGDYYIKLKDRRKKARTLGADVFISIHADAFGKKSANGMSVFALSQRGATSAMAATLAEKENASDLIGGVSLADKDDVLAKVLVDLSMTNTISESVNLGGRVLSELAKHGRLHSKRVEQANFSVLRSPDVPSILVETGFITNPNEERKLRSRKHQARIANAIYLAVEGYFEQTPYASNQRYDSPAIERVPSPHRSTVPAGERYSRHKVKRGDTLSTIAAQYGVSLRELKRLNRISHNTAMLGVKLKVPSKAGPSAKKQSGESLSASIEPHVHVVKNGESLSKISSRYNVTIRAIRNVNGLSGDTLGKGQKLLIPGVSKRVPVKLITHKVRRGDTLSEIAELYNSKVAKIRKANSLKTNTVRLGQVLTIPN